MWESLVALVSLDLLILFDQCVIHVSDTNSRKIKNMTFFQSGCNMSMEECATSDYDQVWNLVIGSPFCQHVKSQKGPWTAAAC